ncbi:ABC transporter substrate-binding protein [Nitratireductor aquibiodomus]|uniref:ABC transporter substrate-binding protein n=1 Tax=Nitratireductor aquibiodomus TaxID=204799 RepID=UPI000468A399|nr:extracellular solute-binding protein [Nitratireductor aquibiodomus]
MSNGKSSSTIGRRSLLKLGAAAGATALAAPFYARNAFATGGSVRVLGVTTVALPDWQGFAADTGMEIEFTPINSDPGFYVQEVVANEVGDDYDVFIFDGGIEDRLGESGHFQAIDGGSLSRWAEVSEEVKTSPLLLGTGGEQYGAPIVFNADSFGYYTDEVGDGAEELSWGTIFENEKLMGKVAIADTWLTALPSAALYLIGKGAKIADPSNMTPQEAAMVVDFLIEQKNVGQFRALWHSYEESVDLLSNQEVLAIECWEPVIKQLQGEGKRVRYANTSEGYSKWMIGAYLPSQAEGERLERAYTAIDWFLGGRYGAEIAVSRGYATANANAALKFAVEQGWSDDQRGAIEDNITKVERKMAAAHYWQNSSPDHVEAIESEWSRFKQA